MTRALVFAALALAAVTLAPAAPAAADTVWQQAIHGGSPDPAQDVYDSAMRSADTLTAQATALAASPQTIANLVTHAEQAYRMAAKAKPSEPEPYYRLGRLMFAFYFDCGTTFAVSASPLCRPGFDRAHALEIIEAWDTFERLAPLDPRVGATHDTMLASDFDLLFHRAVLHTRLADKPNLEAATRDYEEILARSDEPDEAVRGNLAETYMMLDRLDESIDTYRVALRENLRADTVYGLAVALDRAERGEQARDLILAQGDQAFKEFQIKINDGRIFFVPAGEESYYLALINEAFGWDEVAIAAWNRYLASGAHPEFQPRAKAHLTALLAAHKKRGGIQIMGEPWQDFVP